MRPAGRPGGRYGRYRRYGRAGGRPVAGQNLPGPHLDPGPTVYCGPAVYHGPARNNSVFAESQVCRRPFCF